MTKEDIIEKGNFVLNKHNSNYSELKINLYLDFFEKEQEILFANLPNLSSEPQMTVISEIINELLHYDSSNKEWLKYEIWQHYENCVNNTNYGMVAYQGFENQVDANRAYFNIYNKEDAYKAVKLDLILIDIDFTEYRYFTLAFSCSWDDEHGINIGVKNGKFDSIY